MTKLAAFGAIYLIWGSTYLAIKLGIETLPPFLMGGGRFLIAGTVLYGLARLRGAERPTPRNWRAAAGVSGLMLVGGSGLVMWSEQYVDSGIAALIVALVPIWMVILERRRGGAAVSRRVIAGVALGCLGVALLALPSGKTLGGINPLGVGGLILASFFWALGSIRSSAAALAEHGTLAAGTQMLTGGGVLIVVGTLSGEWGRLDASAVSSVSLFAFGYLATMGALVGFSAYMYLLRHCSAASVGTYAFVNPVIALLLGWALAGETLGPRTLFAAIAIIGAVVLIHSTRLRPRIRRYSLS